MAENLIFLTFINNERHYSQLVAFSRHVPALILEIKDIPYTVNGKKVEVAVKRVIAGQKVQGLQATL